MSKGPVICAGLVLVGAFLLGHSTAKEAPAPHIKIVRVPKEVVKHDTKTITTVKPLPASCLELVALLDTELTSISAGSNAAEKVLESIQTAQVALFENDRAAVTKATSVIIKGNDTLGTVAVLGKQNHDRIQARLAQCLKETK